MTEPRIRFTTQRIDIGYDTSGITVEYTKSRRELYLHGWYDHMVGIEGAELPLGEFLRALGVTRKDCERELNP